MKNLVHIWVITVVVFCISTLNVWASPEKTLRLKATTHAAERGAHAQAFTAFLREIEKRTSGRITFDIYYSGTLVSGRDVIDALDAGVADVALVNPGLQSGRLNLAEVGTNPGLYKNAWQGIMATNELYRTVPEMKAELDKYNVQAIGFMNSPSNIILSVKPVAGFKDLKGLRIMTTSRPITSLMKELGAVPVGIPNPEAYEAISKGTVDAIAFTLQGGQSYGLHELVKSTWALPVGGGPSIYAMSKEGYNRLPADIQDIIEDIKENFQPESFYRIYELNEGEVALEKFGEKGVKINDISEEDLKTLQEGAAKVVWSSWVKEMEKKGLPGQKVLDTFKKLADKYKTGAPQ